ncbi:MAG: hypothetical protein U0271_14670 [Polyangiaceae bacterium]
MGEGRPAFPTIYLALARSLAARSTCMVDPVGAVITSVDFRKVLAIGYRGNATGLANQCDREGPDCGCLHGEENAVIQCDAARSEPKIVFSTAMPCRACVKRLINLGGVQDLYIPASSAVDASLVDLLASVNIRVQLVDDRRGGLPQG